MVAASVVVQLVATNYSVSVLGLGLGAVILVGLAPVEFTSLFTIVLMERLSKLGLPHRKEGRSNLKSISLVLHCALLVVRVYLGRRVILTLLVLTVALVVV